MAAPESTWVEVELPDIEVGRVTTVVAAGRALCITRTRDGWGVLDNRCPHQGGPLGGFTVRSADELRDTLERALRIDDRPSLVHIHSSNRDVEISWCRPWP